MTVAWDLEVVSHPADHMAFDLALLRIENRVP